MKALYGVMDESDKDQLWTYEAEGPEEAAELFLDDNESAGVVVRVWNLGRYPAAFVKAANGSVLTLANPAPVSK